MHVYLVPRGSRRGYDLYRGFDRDGARIKGREFAAQLGLPLQELEYVRPSHPAVDLRQPPPHLPITPLLLRNGVQFDLTPRRLFWREWLRVTDQGVEAGIDLVVPWGRRYPSSRKAAWRDVTQVQIGVATNSTRASGWIPRWRFKRNWRADLDDSWRQHCAELKQPVVGVPWWGWFWYACEGWPREFEKTVKIYQRKGPPLTGGSNLETRQQGARVAISRHRHRRPQKRRAIQHRIAVHRILEIVQGIARRVLRLMFRRGRRWHTPAGPAKTRGRAHRRI